MLQAREIACILLFTLGASVGASVGASAAAQEEKAEPPTDSEFNRMGSQAVENEPDLDLWLPESRPPPETAEQRQARLEAERLARLEGILDEANSAFSSGHIDDPYEGSALYHFNAVLALDPENTAALDGLGSVRDALIGRAIEYARDFDFETAEQYLEAAARVRDDGEAVERARDEIAAFRSEHAADLENEAIDAMDAGRFEEAERAMIGLVALGQQEAIVNRLRKRLEEARVYGGLKPGQVIRDHFIDNGFWTPESVIVEAGGFSMGSSAFEEGHVDFESPQHRVIFRRGFAIGRSEVTVEQFRSFIERSGYRTDAEKYGYSQVYDHHSGRITKRNRMTWRNDYQGRTANDDDPVVHVSWNDARAYAHWLAMGTGKPYRLPTEAEFEYALRAGSATRFWWGDGSPSSVVENLTGEKDRSSSRRQWETYFDGYGDRHWGPAPVASFEPNPWGLFDIGGNVAEWVMDCWHDSYIRAPVDGKAWVNPGCDRRVIRGGYWASSPDRSRSAFRESAPPANRDARTGFRIARDL